VIAQLPVDVATYLMNEKREWLHSIEQRSEVDVILVPTATSTRPRTRSVACATTSSACPSTR